MALVPATLASQLEAAMKAAQADPTPAAQTKMAHAMATAIENYFKQSLKLVCNLLIYTGGTNNFVYRIGTSNL